jgi:L-fucose mutarotase/ribose pyranase (RbsD/FucU family)
MSKPLDPLLGPRLPATSHSTRHGDHIVRVEAKCPASVSVMRLRGISVVRGLDPGFSSCL